MLSRTGEYALRAVLLLAQRNGGKALPAGEIASILGVPRNYLSKVMQRLVRRGVLKSVRGPSGGFALARKAETLPISAVVSEFDGVAPLGTCVLGDARCDAKNPCAAHERWKQWSNELARLLDDTTVGELVGEGLGESGVAGGRSGRERKRARR